MQITPQTTPIRFQGITYKIKSDDNRSVVELGKQPGGLGAELCDLYKRHKTDINVKDDTVTFDKPKAARDFEIWLKEQELSYTCEQRPPLQSIYDIHYDNPEQAGTVHMALAYLDGKYDFKFDGSPNDRSPKITISGSKGKDASKDLAALLRSSGIKFDRHA